MKKQKHKNSGITLIALIITVIVLLILAGITINLTLGEDGIIKRAEEAGKTYKNAEQNELASLNSFEASVIPGKVAKTVDGVQYVGDGMGNLIPVPIGFSYLEGTKSTGFVIKNDTDGNEFVWVPVDDTMPYDYERVAFTRDDWSNKQTLDRTTGQIKQGTALANYTEVMPKIDGGRTELDSVSEYKGFYIGRYESGVTGYDANNISTIKDGTETWTGYNNGKLVIQPNQQVWNWITRDRAKLESEGLYTKEKGYTVISRLCSSYAWDTALKFIETKYLKYPTNSVGGYYEQTAHMITGYDTTHPCNIYDMGGMCLNGQQNFLAERIIAARDEVVIIDKILIMLQQLTVVTMARLLLTL